MNTLMKSTIPQWIILTMLLLSIIGLADSSYLTSRHIISHGGLVTCGIEGCGPVLNSQYAEMFGIPVAVLGVIFYGLVFLGLLIYLAKQKKRVLKFVSRFTVVGFLASLYFVYLQLFVIESICAFCFVSAITSTLLFVLGMIVLRHGKQEIRTT